MGRDPATVAVPREPGLPAAVAVVEVHKPWTVLQSRAAGARGGLRGAGRPARHGEKVTAQDYELTSAGQKKAQDWLSSLDRKAKRRMQELVEEYNFRSLSDLLEYTYEEYPEMAERSRWEGKTEANPTRNTRGSPSRGLPGGWLAIPRR